MAVADAEIPDSFILVSHGAASGSQSGIPIRYMADIHPRHRRPKSHTPKTMIDSDTTTYSTLHNEGIQLRYASASHSDNGSFRPVSPGSAAATLSANPAFEPLEESCHCQRCECSRAAPQLSPSFSPKHLTLTESKFICQLCGQASQSQSPTNLTSLVVEHFIFQPAIIPQLCMLIIAGCCKSSASVLMLNHIIFKLNAGRCALKSFALLTNMAHTTPVKKR